MRTCLKILLVFVLSVAAVSFLGACGGGGGGSSSGGGGGGRQWTYMVYLGADNNLSDAGIGDIEEMAQVGTDSNVAIVVQAEFSPAYSQGVPDSHTRRVVIQKGSAVDNLNASTDIGNVDMGSPAALTNFITWATTNYPAQHYALVIWDHGAGWKDRAAKSAGSLLRGAVSDETSGTFMSLPDLASAVRNAGVHMDIINFDACLMAMYEVAYEFKGLVDYMVFSEETEPGDGDPYDTILGDLTGTPSMSASQLAMAIVNRYDESYVSYSSQYGELTTKSAIDMAQIDALDTQILALGQALMNDAAANTVALAARGNAQHYAYTENHDIYDLANYISQNAPAGAAKTAADSVLTTIGSIVITSKTNPDAASVSNHGLAIYFPTASETNASVLADYAVLACNATVRAAATGTWGEYVEYEINQAGGGTATYGVGDFSLRVEWTNTSGGACDADLDLWVIENGIFYAPWMGQTTPNGYFSADSAISGDSMEFYQANPQVETGFYDFMVQYYGNGATCNQATAYLYYNNGLLGSTNMDLSYSYINTGDAANCDAIADLYQYLQCVGTNYSDFLYVGYVQITSPPLAPSGLSKAERNDGITVTKERQRLFQFGKDGRFR